MDERDLGTPGRSERRASVLRVAEVVAFLALGAALGSLVLLVPASGRSLAVQTVFFGVTVAYAAVVVGEQRRQRRQVEAQERGSPAPSTSLYQRPLARRLLTMGAATLPPAPGGPRRHVVRALVDG